jgi:hypothetical protein
MAVTTNCLSNGGPDFLLRSVRSENASKIVRLELVNYKSVVGLHDENANLIFTWRLVNRSPLRS